MKKLFSYLIICGLILIIFSFILIRNNFLAEAQSRKLEIFVLSNRGLIEIEDAGNGVFPFNIPPGSTVPSGMPYRMVLENGASGDIQLNINGNNFIGRCGDLGGYASGLDCYIEGYTSSSGPVSTIQIEYQKGSSLTREITFFVINTTTYYQDKTNQFLLSPVSTTTLPSATITYAIYSNKAYCPSSLSSASSSIEPNNTGFSSFVVTSNEIINSPSQPIYKILRLSGVQPGTYNLKLVDANNQQVSSVSTINVQTSGIAPGTPRCFFGYCQVWQNGRWVTTSTDVCTRQGLDCRPGGIRE